MSLINKILKASTLGVLALGLSGCIISVNDHKESTNRISEKRNVAAFSKIMVDSRVRLDVVVGKGQGISVSGSDKSVFATSTTVSNGTLTINVSGSKSRPRIRVTVPTLDALDFDSRVDARVTGLDVNNFTLNIEGSGDIYLAGTCGTATYEVDGNADVYAERLECNTVDVQMDGNGDITVYAKDGVSVDIDGRSDLTVYGGGRIDTRQISGGGSIQVR